MGGTGSGKTFMDGIISFDFIQNYPDVQGFIGANTYEQLNVSTLKRIRDVWRDHFGLVENVHYVIGKKPPKSYDLRNHNFDDYNPIISFCNGAVVFKGSLDNYEAHSGKEIGWAILDETHMTKEEAVKEVILHRLRQKGMRLNGKDWNPLYISTTPAKVDWINEWFQIDRFEGEINEVIYNRNDYFSKEYDNKSLTICSIFHNKINLPEGHIEGLISEHTNRDGNLTESGKRLIYANPFVKAGGEFYSSFDRSRHVGKVDFIENIPVHLTYDFNVVPYMTLLCWQIVRTGDVIWVRCFGEYCLESPDNSSEAVTLAFKRDYEKRLQAGLFFYGDPSGKHRDTRSRKNDYMIIQQVLRQWVNNYSDRVPHRAPPVLARRDFVNNIFDEKYGIRILVDDKCKKLIADFEYVKEDVDGTKLKQKYKDPETGQSYEKYGHCSDAADYFLTEAFKDIFTKNYI